MSLRAYQQTAHDAAWAHMKRSIDPCLIEAATGAGKSHVIAAISQTVHDATGKRVLCLAPSAELVLQNREKYLASGNKASLFSASAGAKELRHNVVFGSPLTVKNKISRFTDNYALVVVDECFPAGTMIETPRGKVSIENLKTGDLVCNAVGSGQVETKFQKAVTEIYTLYLSNGQKIKCTENHPFFTKRGWVKAKDMEGEVLFSKQDVLGLRRIVPPDLSPTQHDGKNVSTIRKKLDQARDLLTVLRKEAAEPHALECFAGKDGDDFEADWAQANDARRQRDRNDGSTKDFYGDIGRWMDCRASNSNNGGAQKRSVSKPLQGRHSLPRENDSDRIGRRQSRNTETAIRGQEEGQETSRTWVERVSCEKLESPRVVFNLHVSGHPSYYAGGFLVHNCHGLTPTLKNIIASMREGNRSLRVLGLTATPYRLGTGYIFAMWPDGRVNDGSTAYKPYFTKMVDRITAPTLIEMGFLTKPIIGTAGAEGYDTGDMKVNAQGKFNAADVDRAYHGQGRLTSGIVADVMAQCRNRKGVLFFSATVKHANEILASLPPELSEIVTGETPKAKRASILARFKTQQLKYLVNVSVLTTGFDAPHVDCIAILRKTESAGLWAQIMGRGLRLDDGKADCLARGTLILTDKGLVRIEDVTLDYRVWDGASFVSHGGAICKGMQMTIEHDGVCATPDHRVMTNAGWMRISEAKRSGRRIARTGIGRSPVRFKQDHFENCGGSIQQAKSGGGMPILRSHVHEQSEQHEAQSKHAGLPILQRSEACECSVMAIQEMPSAAGQMQKPQEQPLCEIWRARHNVQFFWSKRSCTLDIRKHRCSESVYGIRPHGQRRSLRTGEYEMGSSCCEYEQQRQKQGQQGKIHCVSQRLSRGEICGCNFDEAYIPDGSTGNCEKMGSAIAETEREVWDILNAGPLQRFTANGRLVHNCLILDYTTNIDGHFPDGDFFNPEIEAKEPKIKGEGVNAICPSCAYENNFTAHPDAEGFAIDKNGYCLDLKGNHVQTEYGPMPAHYGRRCWGMERTGPLGQYERCGYRWTFKECHNCEAPNDISARHCIKCKAEIVDPNDKLIAEFKQLKRDPTQVQTDDVLRMDLREGISQAGNKTIRADFVTPYRSFSVWFTPEAKGWKQREEWARFEAATADAKPRTVTYRKDQMSGFYRLLGLNKEKDIAPEKPTIPGLRQRQMAG